LRRAELIKTIERFGCILVRHGAKHDWYRNPSTGISQPVPRHREIKEPLAKHVIKMLRPAETERPDESSTSPSK